MFLRSPQDSLSWQRARAAACSPRQGTTFGQKATEATSQAGKPLHCSLASAPASYTPLNKETPFKNPLSKCFQGKADGLTVHSVTACPSCFDNSPFPAGLSSSGTPSLPLCQLLCQTDLCHKYHKGCSSTCPVG